MNTLTEDLTAILDREADLYDEVLDLAQEERRALVSGPPDGVLGVVQRRDTLLLKIRTVDESRDLVCARLARQWGIGRKSVTLSDVIERCEGPTAQRVAAVRDRLRDSIGRLTQAGRSNATLCHNGIETIRRAIENLSGSAAETRSGAAPYGRTGAPLASRPSATIHLRT